jgi:hypothetical protein
VSTLPGQHAIIVPVQRPDPGVPMARLPYIPSDIVEPREIVDAVRARRGGTLLNLDRMLLHSPPVAMGWNRMMGAVRGDLSAVGDSFRGLPVPPPTATSTSSSLGIRLSGGRKSPSASAGAKLCANRSSVTAEGAGVSAWPSSCDGRDEMLRPDTSGSSG